MNFKWDNTVQNIIFCHKVISINLFLKLEFQQTLKQTYRNLKYIKNTKRNQKRNHQLLFSEHIQSTIL